MKTTKRKRESGSPEAGRKSKTPPAGEVLVGAEPEVAVGTSAEVVASSEAEAAPVHAEAGAGEGRDIVLASHCTLKDAAVLKHALCERLCDPEPVKVDLRNLERIDTSSMQLLCAFVRDRGARQLAVEWVGAPDALHIAARLLGVGALLNLPASAAAGAAS